jgi:RNA polymerase sigma-70 factor (ECF subfamily)
MSEQTPDQQHIATLQESADDPLAVNAAFEGLYETHSETMHRIASRITKSAHTAEDVVQEAFLRLFTNAERIDMSDHSSIRPWLARTTSNIAIDHTYRDSEKAQPSADAETLASTTPATGGNPVDSTSFNEMMEVVARIPEPHKSRLELHLSGVGPQELANREGISESAAKSRLHQARRFARNILRKKLGIHTAADV